MSGIGEKIAKYNKILEGSDCKLVAVSKTKPNEDIQEAYVAGQRIFGENKVQDLAKKAEELPKDIQWHMIGHLQRNKVKYIAPFVSLIHAVDTFKLLKEIDKQASKNDRVIDCMLQVHIAQEDTKHGFSEEEIKELLQNPELDSLKNVKIIGLMGMATNTDDNEQVRSEFKAISNLLEELKSIEKENTAFSELSIGMSGDFKIALEEGSTMIRVGSDIFGSRNY